MSRPWRKDLLRFATSIDAARKRPFFEDAAYSRLERDHMYGFYAVRRLSECFKLTRKSLGRTVSVNAWSFRPGSMQTHLNWGYWDDHYDPKTERNVSLGVLALANQVIHSFIFTIALTHDGRLGGLFVSSDWQRRKCLFYIPAWKTSRLFRRVAADWPAKSKTPFDERSSDVRLPTGMWARYEPPSNKRL